MKITIKTESYNHRRHGRPWIALVSGFDGAKPVMCWGNWCSDNARTGGEGVLEIDADPGDVVAHGQRDLRRPDKTDTTYSIVQIDGSLTDVPRLGARDHLRSRATPTPLAPEEVGYDPIALGC